MSKSITELQNELEKLKHDNTLLRNLILQMVQLDDMQSENIEAWEIKNMLREWATGRKG